MPGQLPGIYPGPFLYPLPGNAYLLSENPSSMRKPAFIIFLVLTGLSVAGQTKKRFTVKPGERALEVIPQSDIYRYPAFQQATVVFRDGKSVQTRINYNSVFGEMQFIHTTGDTLSLDDENNVRWILAGTDTFYFFEGWLEQIAAAGDMKLARKKLIQVSNKEKIGGMDIPAFGAVETNTKSTMSQQTRDLVAKEQLTYTEYYSYYFGDRFNQFFPAGKKSLLKIYSEKEARVQPYLKTHTPDYKKEEELRRLVLFLSGL